MKQGLLANAGDSCRDKATGKGGMTQVFFGGRGLNMSREWEKCS